MDRLLHTVAIPPPPAATPGEEVTPLTGDELRWLIGIRIALGCYVLVNLATAASRVAQFRNLGLGTTWIGPVVQSSLVSMAPAAILLLTLRNPPGRFVPGLVAGMSFASLLFRIVMPAFAETLGLRHLPQPVLRTALLYVLEGVMASLAIGIRWRLERNVDAWIALAIVGFLAFDVLVRIPWHVVR